MSENIIKTKDRTIILNGGDPLKGCPESWDEARAWENESNHNKAEDVHPFWSFDCGFKLDYDGPILRISSRFYPPKSHYGPTWDGTVTVYLFSKEILEKKFDCESLSQLRKEVNRYTKTLGNKIKRGLL